ncbi:hypothetical protein ACFSQJ_03825 [Croceitalea marina]|uniref:Uncharacterized protein n=1 Tax=Croceitalea marina TaxID=1775166 RepID=A0ABW5MS07_9FLAO
MTCKHLNRLEKDLIRKKVKVRFRGQAWGRDCREWVYFDCFFSDLEETIRRFDMDGEIIKIHTHLGTHDGQEHGLVCSKCNDGIMGYHPNSTKQKGDTAITYT